MHCLHQLTVKVVDAADDAPHTMNNRYYILCQEKKRAQKNEATKFVSPFLWEFTSE